MCGQSRAATRPGPPGADGPDAPADPSVLGLVGDAAVEALHHRVELAALETAEARDHALATAAFAGAAAGLGLLTGFAFTLLVLVLVWTQPWRGAVLAGLALLYAAGAGALIVVVRARLRRWRPFHEISEQLRKDAACLHDLMNPSGR